MRSCSRRNFATFDSDGHFMERPRQRLIHSQTRAEEIRLPVQKLKALHVPLWRFRDTFALWIHQAKPQGEPVELIISSFHFFVFYYLIGQFGITQLEFIGRVLRTSYWWVEYCFNVKTVKLVIWTSYRLWNYFLLQMQQHIKQDRVDCLHMVHSGCYVTKTHASV